jgi:DNA invertase Pin-like site-specific DNA recombinase
MAEAWCAAQGWELVATYDETSEKGWQSGRAEMNDRPYVQKMLDDARAGKFDVVVFKDATRLGRDKLEAQGLANDLRRAGVPLVGFSVQKTVLDVSADMDGMLFDFGQTAAQMDWRTVTTNMLIGRYNAAKNWGRYSSGIPPEPYTLDANKKPVVDPERAEAVIAALKLIASGISATETARLLGERFTFAPKRGGKSWTSAHVISWLENDALTGAGIVRWLTKDKTIAEKHKDCRHEKASGDPAVCDNCGRERIVIPAERVVPDDLMTAARLAWGKQSRAYWDLRSGDSFDKHFYPLAERVVHRHADGYEATMFGHYRGGKSRAHIRVHRCSDAVSRKQRGIKATCPGFGWAKKGVRRTSLKAGIIEAGLALKLLDALSSREAFSEFIAESDRQHVASDAIDQTLAGAQEKLKALEVSIARVIETYLEGLIDKTKRDAKLAALESKKADLVGIVSRSKTEKAATDAVAATFDELIAGTVNLPQPGDEPLYDEDVETGERLTLSGGWPETHAWLTAQAEEVLAGERQEMDMLAQRWLGDVAFKLDARVVVTEGPDGLPELKAEGRYVSGLLRSEQQSGVRWSTRRPGQDGRLLWRVAVPRDRARSRSADRLQ